MFDEIDLVEIMIEKKTEKVKMNDGRRKRKRRSTLSIRLKSIKDYRLKDSIEEYEVLGHGR